MKTHMYTYKKKKKTHTSTNTSRTHTHTFTGLLYIFPSHQTLLKVARGLQHLVLADTGVGDLAFLVDPQLQHPLEVTGQVSSWPSLLNRPAREWASQCQVCF